VLKNLNPYSFSMYLRNICGLSKIHKEKYASFYEKGFNEIYDEILDISKSCNTLGEFKDTLISIKPAEVKVNSEIKNSMLITTFHQSKGLEFDCVFIPDVCEGKVPAGMSVAECRVEEERRLFYVALTRAKEHLFIYTIKNEESGGTLPSRFLNDFYF